MLQQILEIITSCLQATCNATGTASESQHTPTPLLHLPHALGILNSAKDREEHHEQFSTEEAATRGGHGLVAAPDR
jgi:hypothetical protein